MSSLIVITGITLLLSVIGLVLALYSREFLLASLFAGALLLVVATHEVWLKSPDYALSAEKTCAAFFTPLVPEPLKRWDMRAYKLTS